MIVQRCVHNCIIAPKAFDGTFMMMMVGTSILQLMMPPQTRTYYIAIFFLEN